MCRFFFFFNYRRCNLICFLFESCRFYHTLSSVKRVVNQALCSKNLFTNPCVQALTRVTFPLPHQLQIRRMSHSCLSFTVNVCRGLLYPSLQFTGGCSQRHRRVHPLSHHHINAVFLLFSFGPNWVNVTYEYIRDVTMFSMLIFEKNLLNKNYTGEGGRM